MFSNPTPIPGTPPWKSLCTTEQWNQIERYNALVLQKNTVVNLVSRKDTANLIEHHVVPSLLFKALNRILDHEYILDIGSGGGFPGIINAIVFSNTEFLLVDATRKKVAALQEFITELALTNVQAIWSRVEELDPQIYGQTFDRTTSRAVAPLRELVQWSTPYLKPGGTVEALKGGDLTAELNQLTNSTTTSYPAPEQWHSIERLKTTHIVSVVVA